MVADDETVQDWCSWAQAEYGLGRAERALAGFRRALTVDLSSFPARFGLASILLDRGDLAGAGELANQMAAQDAQRPDVLWLQSRLAMARGEASAATDTLTRLLADARLGAAQRAEALLLLGLALGDLARHPDAFDAARRGKQAQRSLHAGQAATREGEVAKYRRLDAWLDTTSTTWRLPPTAPAPGAAATHVFLLGFPRSGTTLLEQILAAHRGIDALEEAPTLATAYQAFLSDAGACASLMRIGADEAAAWVDHYWGKVREHGIDPAGRVFVDKQPAGTLALPVIARLFPDAKILFALRDPRDVVLSCFRQAFQINAMTYAFTDLAEAAACYDACMTLAGNAKARLPLAWTDVRHEALIGNFDAELARILDFLGVAIDPAMRDFARSAATRTIRTPSAIQVRAGLNERGLGRWRHYERELAPVMPVLTPWLGRLGYAP